MIELQKLFLLKDGKQDIYVDISKPLPQHQLDGIRFLYRQFKKKNPGVILNDPSGYGKCLQTVLFLNAVRPMLDKPIFIMCDEDEIDNWKEQFQKWTDFEDIAMETSNPFAKNTVYINTAKDAYTFSRKNWSMVILHDNTFAKEKLKAVFKADFKIWVTSVDMKENLRAFSLIYEWLHPNTKVNLEDFEAEKNNPRDVIEKSILLDAFFEDVVIRRDDFLTPFTSKIQVRRHREKLESPPKATRKNKDPTGTKVKRTKKRKIDDDSDITADISINRVNVTDRNETVSDNTEDVFNFTINNDTRNKANHKSDEMDIESFIRNQEPIEAEEYDTSQKSSVATANSKSDTSNEFQNAVKEVIDNDNKSGHVEYEITGIDNESVTNYKLQFSTEDSSESTQTYFDIMDNNGENINMKDGNTAMKDISAQLENESVELKDYEYNDISKKEGTVVLNSSASHRSVNLKNTNDLDKSEIDKKGKTDSEEVELDNVKNSDKIDDVGSSKNNPNVQKKFDDIMAELEEKTLKKFKGSFLDSLF